MAKKLWKAERTVDEALLVMLEWASDRPDRWHSIGKLQATRRAAELLAERGVIGTRHQTNLYRLKQPTNRN